MVLAFGSDPPARWMFPDPHQYLSHFPHFVRAFGGRALDHRSAYYVDNFAGVSLWLPPGVQPDETALVALLERSVSAERLPYVFAILEQLGRFHPTEAHWYLPMTGVDPSKQGNGYGSTMLRHALQGIDQDQLPAYLESTNPGNIGLYERHGFKLLGTIEVADAPPMFPMLREARGSPQDGRSG
jgi:ribosomal protein S18 acetylase RimI-like enzyme